MRLAAEAGVKVAMGTDAAVMPHGWNLNELLHMANNGFTPEQALHAATLSAAELMGWDDRLGSLEPGKIADVVVVDGDPFAFDTLQGAHRAGLEGRRPRRLRHGCARARAVLRVCAGARAISSAGLMTRRLGVALVMAISQGAGLVLTGLLILALGEPAPETRYLLLRRRSAGCRGAIGLAALYQGLAIGPMSVVAPIASLSVIVPVLVGFATGDRPAPLQLSAWRVAIIGIVLAAREADPTDIEGAAEPPERRGWRGPGVVYALVAACSWDCS